MVVDKEYSLVIKNKIPNQDCNYPDHVGLQVKLVIEKRVPTGRGLSYFLIWPVYK